MKLLKYIFGIIVLSAWLILSLIIGLIVGLFLGFAAWHVGVEKYIELTKLRKEENV
jgi:uncharacterized membrane-anchored protein YhcB (DUF1043 family)